MTIIEVLIAGVVLTLSALAVLTLADTASHNTFRAEQSQVVVNRLQAEMEHIRQLSYSELALTGRPPYSTGTGNPTDRVSTGGTRFEIARDGTGSRPIAYAGGTTPDGKPVGCSAPGNPVPDQPTCAVDPGPTPFQSGDIKGEIYRYVVYPWAGSVPPECADCSADDMKRVVVAIRLDTTAAGGSHTYQEIQSNVANSNAVPGDNPVPPCNPSTQACSDQQIATFWLTDTPCNFASRQPLAGNHAAHNTRGVCDNGMQTGTTRGAPDLMFNDRPPDSNADYSALYDYSQDVVRPQGDSSFGLAVPKETTPSACPLAVTSSNAPNQLLDLPSAETNPEVKMHSWVSNEFGADNTLAALTQANATLELWTKSVGGTSYPGKVCVSVFKRMTVQVSNAGVPSAPFVVDSPAVMTAPQSPPAGCAWTLIVASCSNATWPQQWTKLSVPMSLTMQSVTQVLNQLSNPPAVTASLVRPPRLGLAITVDNQGTSGSGLEFMYDHPDYDSRLEVDTPHGVCLLPCSP